MDDVSRKELSPKEDGSSFFQKCLNQAIVYLSIREHNRRELGTKLRAKGHDIRIVEKVLDQLEDDGSLSEERYVRSFIRSNNRRHPEGKAIVVQRLAAKGADREVSRRILDETYTREYTADLVSQARLLISRKGISGKRVTKQGASKQGRDGAEEEVKAALLKLGFSYSDIRDEE